MVIPAIARITGVSGRLEIAEAAAEALLSEQFVNLGFAMSAKAGLALLAVQKGDQTAAEEHYDYLLGQRTTMIWAVSSVDRLLGLLSQTMNNLDRAVAHFEDALNFCRKAGYRPELAWTCHDYGANLAQRNGFEDRIKASSLLDESLTISAELGMRPLTEKVTALRESLGVQRARIMKYPSNMTERQWEVLRLLAVGKTNREIAQALVLSGRTVQRHIADIYPKIGARNRSEATAFAMRHMDPVK